MWYCAQVEFEIHQHLDLLKRDARVRVKQWLQKFRQETANTVWKRNRNTHARLLLEQLRAGRLTDPFTSLPGPGCLPTLGRWALAPFLTPQKKAATSPRLEISSNQLRSGSSQQFTIPRVSLYNACALRDGACICRKDQAAGMGHAESCPPRLTAAQDRYSPFASTSGGAQQTTAPLKYP